jgi:hypothetical protein
VGADEDGVHNVLPPEDGADADAFDDGLVLALDSPDGGYYYLEHVMSVDDTAPATDRYVNVWMD